MRSISISEILVIVTSFQRCATAFNSPFIHHEPSFQSKLSATTVPSINPFTSPLLSSDCDNVNTPPSLSGIINSINALKSGSDIRGTFIDHDHMGSIINVSLLMKNNKSRSPLTPLSAYCYGYAFAKMIQIECGKGSSSTNMNSLRTKFTPGSFFFEEATENADLEEEVEKTVICVGRDPRIHGGRIADSLCRGIEAVSNVKVAYTGLASTPSMFEFCRADMCDGSIMVTASHLPEDRNGFKLFTKKGGFTNTDIDTLAEYATSCAKDLYDIGLLPPISDSSSLVDLMPHYASTLRNAIIREVNEGTDIPSTTTKPLAGLKIVLNAGNGSGCFFNEILKDLGADVSNSMNLTPDGTFPDTGVPNPENKGMIDATMRVCEEVNADIGIMLDTDADRCGFVIPRNTDGATSKYEALNRNRLIALLSFIFHSSSPGCSIVTDSVTSEGLSKFLEEDLGLKHVRYLKGYSNVIGKAKELTGSGKALVEMAIETSGHCAMRENDYLDDGTYTAVKVIGLLARTVRSKGDGLKGHVDLLDLISGLKEMDEVNELRIPVSDGSLASTNRIFSTVINEVMELTSTRGEWELDRDNLEGLRVRNGADGSFFMLRKSLHDPVISLQVEGSSESDVRKTVVVPLLGILDEFSSSIDLTALTRY